MLRACTSAGLSKIDLITPIIFTAALGGKVQAPRCKQQCVHDSGRGSTEANGSDA